MSSVRLHDTCRKEDPVAKSIRGSSVSVVDVVVAESDLSAKSVFLVMDFVVITRLMPGLVDLDGEGSLLEMSACAISNKVVLSTGVDVTVSSMPLVRDSVVIA